jgi:hypothetical protein
VLYCCFNQANGCLLVLKCLFLLPTILLHTLKDLNTKKDHQYGFLITFDLLFIYIIIKKERKYK